MIARAIEIKVITNVLRVPSETDFSTKIPVAIVVSLAKFTCAANIAFALSMPFSANFKLTVAALMAFSWLFLLLKIFSLPEM